LSVVVPVCNEEGNVSLLVERLMRALATVPAPPEIIIVDDGSRDGTWRAIQRATEQYGTVRGLRLARNFGHQHALLAGLAHARGAAIVTMDGDLQHPPELLPALFDAWRAGYRIVRTERVDDGVASPFKRASSRWFYRAFSALAEIEIRQGMSDFRLIDRAVLADVLRFNDKDIFLRGIVEWLGYEVTTIPFRVERRHSGQTKYPLARMLRFASGAIVSFSTKPLRLGIWIGLLTGGAALCELLYVVLQYFRGQTVPGWASIISVMSLLFAVLFFVLGVIGMYVARIHEVLQNRPRYVIAERASCPGPA
jgi:dolichol-phosphate mannosyltransferase